MSAEATIRRARSDDREAATDLWAQLQAEHEALDTRHRLPRQAADG